MPSSFRFRRGFSLIELLLTLGVIALLLVAVFVIYPNVRSNMNAKRETEFVTALLARYQSQYNGNYAGISADWNAAKNVQPWATSPNNWNWSINPAVRSGASVASCTGSRCPVLWLQLYYRTEADKDAAECQALLTRLSAIFTIPGYTEISPDTMVAQCDKVNGPIFISLVQK